jgi:hypothetical protein
MTFGIRHGGWYTKAIYTLGRDFNVFLFFFFFSFLFFFFFFLETCFKLPIMLRQGSLGPDG